jgi:hypothetical protein
MLPLSLTALEEVVLVEVVQMCCVLRGSRLRLL